MLKRGMTRSNDVLPSAVTSTTAQGFLPQYTGYDTLAASLNPSLLSPSRNSPEAKSSNDGGAFLTPFAEKHGERRSADFGTSSLEEQFRNIVINDNRQRAALPPHWKSP